MMKEIEREAGMADFVCGTSGDPFSDIGEIIPLRLAKRICRRRAAGGRETFFGVIATRSGVWVGAARGPASEAQPEIMRRAALAASRGGFRGVLVAGLAPGKQDRLATMRALGATAHRAGKALYRVSRNGEVTPFPAMSLNLMAPCFDADQLPSRSVFGKLTELLRKKIDTSPDLIDLGPEDDDAVSDSEPWREGISSSAPVTRIVGPAGGGKTRLLGAIFGIPWKLLPAVGGPRLGIENDPFSPVFRLEVRFMPRAEISVLASARVFDAASGVFAAPIDAPLGRTDVLRLLASRKGFSLDPFFGGTASSDPAWDEMSASVDAIVSDYAAGRSKNAESMIWAASDMVTDHIRDRIIGLPFGYPELSADGGLVRFRHASKGRASLFTVMRRFAPARPPAVSFYGVSAEIMISGPFLKGYPAFAVTDDISAPADRTVIVEKAIKAGDSVDMAMAAAQTGPVFSALTMLDETPDFGVSGHEVRRLRRAWASVPRARHSSGRGAPFMFGDLLAYEADGKTPLAGLSPQNVAEARRMISMMSSPEKLEADSEERPCLAPRPERRWSREETSLRNEIMRLRGELIFARS